MKSDFLSELRVIKYLESRVLDDVWKECNHTKICNQVFTEIDLRGARTILDVGCGDGAFVYALLKWLPNGSSIAGFDLTASDVWEKLSGFDSLRLFTANAEKIPLPANSFDLVFCKDVLHHAKAPEKVIREMVRVSLREAVIIEANRSNPIMMLHEKYRGHRHLTREALEALVQKTLGDAEYRFSTIDAYPFYFPVTIHGVWALPFFTANVFMAVAFKVFHARALADWLSDLMCSRVKEPAFNMVRIKPGAAGS